MEKFEWIKDLVLAEREMEQKGMVEVPTGQDATASLERLSIELLRNLKEAFTDAAQTYNSFRQEPTNQIKIYGVSKTLADFMLFRGGMKLIFSLREPGTIQIYSSQLPTFYLPTQDADENSGAVLRHVLKAKWGAFDELIWTYKGESVNLAHLVRYYFTLFIRLSSSNA